ncbi:MAG: MaoC/PaaZ C-terminal domain-containing protein, partial [Bdellovibrionota bacterium]
LKLYAQASADHNPIHLDEAVARKVGLPGVIAHGMLTMAFMGEFLYQALGSHAKTGRIEEMSCRFKAMTLPGDVITITGVVRDVIDGTAHCDLEAKKESGEITATGFAVLRG